MKTIAITIEEPTLKRVDRLLVPGGHWRNRSEIIRQAINEFITQVELEIEETREREIFRRNRSRLNRQIAAMVKEQAQV